MSERYVDGGSNIPVRCSADSRPPVNQHDLAWALADFFESERASQGGVKFFMKAAQAILDRHGGRTLALTQASRDTAT